MSVNNNSSVRSAYLQSILSSQQKPQSQLQAQAPVSAPILQTYQGQNNSNYSSIFGSIGKFALGAVVLGGVIYTGKSITSLNKTVDQQAKVIDDLSGKISNVASNNQSTDINKAIENLKTQLNTIQSSITNINIPSVEPLINTLSTINSKITALGTSLSQMNSKLSTIENNSNLSKTDLSNIIKAVQSLDSKTQGIADNMAKKSDLPSNIDTSKLASDVINGVDTRLQRASQTIGEKIDTATSTITDNQLALKKDISEKINGVLSSLKQTISEGDNISSEQLNSIQNSLSEQKQILDNILVQAKTNGSMSFADLIAQISKELTAQISKLNIPAQPNSKVKTVKVDTSALDSAVDKLDTISKVFESQKQAQQLDALNTQLKTFSEILENLTTQISQNNGANKTNYQALSDSLTSIKKMLEGTSSEDSELIKTINSALEELEKQSRNLEEVSLNLEGSLNKINQSQVNPSANPVIQSIEKAGEKPAEKAEKAVKKFPISTDFTEINLNAKSKKISEVIKEYPNCQITRIHKNGNQQVIDVQDGKISAVHLFDQSETLINSHEFSYENGRLSKVERKTKDGIIDCTKSYFYNKEDKGNDKLIVDYVICEDNGIKSKIKIVRRKENSKIEGVSRWHKEGEKNVNDMNLGISNGEYNLLQRNARKEDFACPNATLNIVPEIRFDDTFEGYSIENASEAIHGKIKDKSSRQALIFNRNEYDEAIKNKSKREEIFKKLKELFEKKE